MCQQIEEGNKIGICMRDDTFELNVIPNRSNVSGWHRVNMETLEVEKMYIGTVYNDPRTDPVLINPEEED